MEPVAVRGLAATCVNTCVSSALHLVWDTDVSYTEVMHVSVKRMCRDCSVRKTAGSINGCDGGQELLVKACAL